MEIEFQDYRDIIIVLDCIKVKHYLCCQHFGRRGTEKHMFSGFKVASVKQCQ